MKRLLKIVLLSLLIFPLSCRDSELNPLEPPVEQDGKVYARIGYDDVEMYARHFDTSLELIIVKSTDVNTDGSSAAWTYQFLSATDPTIYYFTRTFDEVSFDSTGSILVGPAIIVETWINSNQALYVAEMNGGNEFKNRNEDYKITAVLSKSLVPDSLPVWSIVYRSGDSRLNIRVDAVSGQVLEN